MGEVTHFVIPEMRSIIRDLAVEVYIRIMIQEPFRERSRIPRLREVK